ncbi:MAG: ankyrin repeat domain-containing protein [Planctomycetota bacterium]
MRRLVKTALILTAIILLAHDAARGRFSAFRDLYNRNDLNRRLISVVSQPSPNAAHIRALLRKGADPNARLADIPSASPPVSNVGFQTATPLHWAVGFGQRDVVELLLAWGARANAADDDGWTPLHEAAQEMRPDIVRLLLRHGADPSAKRRDGWTPLHAAVINYHRDVIRLLLDAGADPNLEMLEHLSLLHRAALRNDRELAEILIRRGADVNARGEQGLRPLHIAAFQGDKEIVLLLLAHGADINAPDDHGATPLDRAENAEIRDLLCKPKGAGDMKGK